MQKIKKLLKNSKGLTLIEILAVIVIIAIVAVIAVPAIGNVINNSQDKAILADASSILAGAKIAVQDNGCSQGDVGQDFICTDTDLHNYVENVDAEASYTAKKANGKWYVQYSKFNEIANSKYAQATFEQDLRTSNDFVSEKDLNNLLKGNGITTVEVEFDN